MRLLPSGSTALLAELDRLEDVLGLYAALRESTPAGVVDLVPAGRTLLVVIDPAATDLAAVRQAVLATPPRAGEAGSGDLVEIPVTYDGDDLADAAAHLGIEPAELVRRHTGERWTVAFCGFAPGFGYLVGERHSWDLPRRTTPRTSVPAGSVALAGEFTGVYPRASPGGWQLVGRTSARVFDLDREQPALLTPGTRVRFVRVDTDADGRGDP
jgi:KipI family sensor histidine kinase inhibitor